MPETDQRCGDELAGKTCQRLPGHDGDHEWADALTRLTWAPVAAEEAR